MLLECPSTFLATVNLSHIILYYNDLNLGTVAKNGERMAKTIYTFVCLSSELVLPTYHTVESSQLTPYCTAAMVHNYFFYKLYHHIRIALRLGRELSKV